MHYNNIRIKQDGSYIINLNGMDYHVTQEYPAHGAYTYANLHAYVGAHPDEVTNYVEPLPPEPETKQYNVEDAITKVKTLIQARLDNFARTLTYDSILSATTYAVSTNAVYAIEGQYCTEMRDKTWDTAFVILTQIQGEIAGDDKTFTETELAEIWEMIEAQLPPLAWPEGSRGYQA